MVKGRVVRPRSAREVEGIANQARKTLGLAPGDRVSMTPLLEQVLYEVIDGYEFRVEEDRKMGQLEGLTDYDRPVIHLKSSVYNALQRGEGRARMTAAHEFGHLLMHSGMPSYLAFTTRYLPLNDPERQANIFAAAFLMPREAFLRCRTVESAMTTFGVSRDAALCRARKLKHRFGQASAKPYWAKKKGSSMRRTP